MASPKPELPFPPLTIRHILNCSYHAWHPRYRALTPKARVIPVSEKFLRYLRADGIVLPPDSSSKPVASARLDINEGDLGDDSDREDDPSTSWPETHSSIVSTIASLGGHVTPKLNWSAPKDATWINPFNTLECCSANDVYMMLKSSDFITHDLEHAFDGCLDANAANNSSRDDLKIPYHLVLRKWVAAWNPSVECRCFVRRRKLLGLCQRDLNHYDFLPELRPKVLELVQEFFEKQIRNTFPDENFVFDVYVPQPYNRVWLVDFNPWALRTDPILFSWLELLTMEDPINVVEEDEGADDEDASFMRLPIWTGAAVLNGNAAAGIPAMPPTPEESGASSDEDDPEVSADLSGPRTLELRLIKRGDPEAFSFSTQQYSAHKLPREVVDASSGGYDAEQMRDFSKRWQDLVSKGEAQHQGEDSSDGDETT
ncbi:MAG: hypothetical protein Q9159_006722 [Coniocarpon cinnabarinum]